MTCDPQPAAYGLIGYPLSHSFSPRYFAQKFLRERIDARYEAFPLESIDRLEALLTVHPGLHGLSVTTPYKVAVMTMLDALSEDARAIGAVNCIAINSGKLHGYNTDWTGFRDSILPLLRPHHRAALILGSGGAALAVRYALQALAIPFHTIARDAGKGDFVYAQVPPQIIARHPLIINTTTLGTEGEGLPSIPYDALTPRHLLYDLVYNPPTTPFLQAGSERGAAIKNGLEMLELQAEASWAIWCGA